MSDAQTTIEFIGANAIAHLSSHGMATNPCDGRKIFKRRMPHHFLAMVCREILSCTEQRHPHREQDNSNDAKEYAEKCKMKRGPLKFIYPRKHNDSPLVMHEFPLLRKQRQVAE